MEKKSMNLYYRLAIVLVLIFVVVALFVFKGKREIGVTHETHDTTGVVEESLVQSTDQQTDIKTDSAVITSVPGETLADDKVRIPKTTSLLDIDILAVVNDEEITRDKFESTFNALPSQMKDYFKDDKVAFFEELILRQLLLQDARKKTIQEHADYKKFLAQDPEQHEDIMIRVLIKTITDGVMISESELRTFFSQYEDQLPDEDFGALKEQLRPMALEEKQRQVLERYFNNLKSRAEIRRNEKWLQVQETVTADDPLNHALKETRPVLADFGRGTCIPCKMMQPILEKLEREYKGKASILILDVGEYAALARKHRIMMIPTQIFFDANGNEVYRHQGFMAEKDIVAQLKKMGVE